MIFNHVNHNVHNGSLQRLLGFGMLFVGLPHNDILEEVVHGIQIWRARRPHIRDSNIDLKPLWKKSYMIWLKTIIVDVMSDLDKDHLVSAGKQVSAIEAINEAEAYFFYVVDFPFLEKK
ncbi:hypothetical protein CDAR_486171 [Caerostris darwini]|uniref:Uncharacterized protein n=1 Tax=Caerostris darwini TaxID=1538125 RepID=A0AAV4MAH9_9ARAC|nr:hypothetical protein CDAR_486171 [Caerostris darwini]